MAARMYWRCPVGVMVSMKSTATSALAWLLRKSAQVVADRSGAGIDAFGLEDLLHGGRGDFDPEHREFAVDASVSPGRVFHGPGAGLGCEWSARWVAARAASAWTRSHAAVSSGRDASAAQYPVGLPVAVGAGSHAGRGWSSAARKARSADANLTLLDPSCRCSTVIWWRRARISAVLVAVAHRQQAQHGERRWSRSDMRGEAAQVDHHAATHPAPAGGGSPTRSLPLPAEPFAYRFDQHG